MRRAWLIGIVLAAATAAGALAQVGFRPLVPDEDRAEALILERANALRQSEDRAPLAENARLTAAARGYARFLAGRDGLSHTADGRDPGARAQAAGYQYCEIAENLAFQLHSRGFQTEALAEQLMDGWKRSPGHRENLLRRGVTETGVAVVKAPDRTPKYVAVQLFGRPLSLQYAFTVTNRSSRLVEYRFGERRMRIEPRMTITHTVCEQSPLVFGRGGGRFSPAAGDAFRLLDGPRGTVTVESG